MKRQKTPPTLLCDFYKVCHMNLYVDGTEKIYTTWTPRSSKHGGNIPYVVVSMVQGFVKKYLIDYFDENFFGRKENEVADEYVRVLKYTLGEENPDATHIRKLHRLGYLPIKLKALREGLLAPIKTPILTIENTLPEFFWLTNYLETIMSTELWQGMTSATKAYHFRQLLDKYAMETVGNTDFVNYAAHDFSMRGMSSKESAELSGAGHLFSFLGTDTIPAICYLEQYYNANIEKELVGCSVKATEHSIQCSYGQDEIQAFSTLLDKVPNGILSIVADTWDFWGNIEKTLPVLKDKIMKRDGTLVIRPDSGTPELILCGDPNGETESERKGLVECLWDLFGGHVNELGYKVLDPHVSAIYGDSIDYQRAETILSRLKEKGFATSNLVMGLGSFFYQFNTRDTFGFAAKATYALINGEEKLLFKDPKTDDGTKRSQRGMVAVVQNDYYTPNIETIDGLYKEDYDSQYADIDLLETVFLNGELKRDQSLSEIRELLKRQ